MKHLWGVLVEKGIVDHRSLNRLEKTYLRNVRKAAKLASGAK